MYGGTHIRRACTVAAPP